MRVLFVSSEIYPLVKTGGLADVSAALPRALAEMGVDIRLIMPGYPAALAAAVGKTVQVEIRDFDGQPVTRLIAARMPDSDLPVWLVDCPSLFDRDGTPYQDRRGCDFADNAERFAHFTRVAAKVATGELVPGWRCDVVHGNDWHTGLLPLFLETGHEPQPQTLFTIHNLAFQGLFDRPVAASLGLGDDICTPEGVEFHGRISFLKAGIRFADRLTTVSPAYADEILTPEHGCGLDGLLRERAGDLTGILNGVDYDVWNPATDLHLPATFSASDVADKHMCKAEVQRELGLAPAPKVPLIIWISRITHQKMADTAADLLPELLTRDVQFAILGQGDPALEARFTNLADAYPGRLAVRIGYEEPLAHRLYAGGDLLLHPARFEPCGLTPLYALRYGTIPLVRRVGGLTDTVVPASEETLHAGTATGFTFDQPDACTMLEAIDRALAVYAKPVVWRKLQQRAMTRDFSWDYSARRFLAIYHELAPAVALVRAERAAEPKPERRPEALVEPERKRANAA
jgi:starch synthase